MERYHAEGEKSRMTLNCVPHTSLILLPPQAQFHCSNIADYQWDAAMDTTRKEPNVRQGKQKGENTQLKKDKNAMGTNGAALQFQLRSWHKQDFSAIPRVVTKKICL